MTFQLKAMEMKEPRDCHRWESCASQLCPLDSEFSVWRWDEEICKLRGFQNRILIKNQKKIAWRKAEGSFTKSMLDRKIIVGKSIKGLVEPDDRKAELTWMEKHKEYLRVMTVEQENELVSRVRLK